MRMMDQRLAPGMEHSEEPDLSAKMLRIGGDRAYGLGSRVKEHAVHLHFVLRGDRCDLVRHREDTVKILAVEELRAPVLDPRGARQ